MERNLLQFNNDEEQDLFVTNKKESAVDLVVNNIKNLLITKKLVPGDKLPSEAELCKSMAVSRGSLREAMKILSAFGIIEIKRGDGTYIAKSNNEILFDPFLFSLIQSQADIKELTELRALMEHAVVKLIIDNADEKDIEDIKSSYLKMYQAIKDGKTDPKVLAQYDIDFHAALGRATKNILVEKIYSFVLDLFNPSVQKTHENQETGLDALNVHKNIIESIVKRDYAEGYKAVEHSIVVWKTLIK
jgi:GntR family transcriptional regulator, transcriptional repressor for pyruvate dehydrogenase complex